MRKIFEFRVFDILQDKENVKFLDKVKKDNPELYNKFLNLIGNKGLIIAKEKYMEFEPEYKKKMAEKEKKRKDNIKKIESKEAKKNYYEKILIDYESEITDIRNKMYSSELFNIDLYISKDKNISKYFNSTKIKSRYVDVFDKLIRKTNNFTKDTYGYFEIDNINFNSTHFKNIFTGKIPNFISIHQFYNLRTKLFKYSIIFNEDLFDSNIFLQNIENKNKKFIADREYKIEELKKFFIFKNELYKTIDDFSNLLSDEYYNEWKIINDTDKFNI